MKQKLLNLKRLRGLMLLVCMCILGAGTAWGDETITLTQSNLGLTGGYTTNTSKTIDGITFVYTDLLKSNDNIQAKASSGVIYNSTACPGDIKKVVITHSGTARSTTILGSSDGEDWEQVATGSGSITGDFSGKGYKYFQITRGSYAAYWTKIEITYSPSSGLTPNDLTLNATEKSFDLADGDNLTFQLTNSGSANGTLSFETNNGAVATVSETGLITAVGDGTAIITVKQAKSDTYEGGTATCTVTVTDSRYTISDLTFTAACGGSGTADDGANWTVTSDADESSFDNTKGIHYGTGSKTVSFVSLATNDIFGTIKKIVVNASGANGTSATVNVSVNGSAFGNGVELTSSASDYTFTGNGEGEIIVRLSQESATKALYVKSIKVYYIPSNDPKITASDVEIAYDATEGSISYTIDNEPNPAGTLTASTPSGSWITLGNETSSPISFTCDANTGEERTATVTLTYTYNTNETVTKEITVTQAAAPVIYTTIPAIFAAATTTETDVKVTFNNWVVSGVSTNGKNIFVTDNDGNGFVIYSNSDMSGTFSAGNILSGTAVACDLVLYNGFAELKNLDASELTISSGGTVATANVAMADLAGVNTGALVSYDNLTCRVDNNKYYLTDGTTTIQVYNSLYAFNALEAGKTYNITGVYQQYNNTKEILPRSADDIVKVEVPVQTTITAGTLSYVAISSLYDGDMEDITLGENVAEGTLVYFTLSVDEGYNLESVTVLNANNEEVTLTENQGSWSFTMPNSSVTINATATSSTPATGDKYVKVTSTNDITDGQYLIVYEEGSVAFDGSLETLDAVGNTIEVIFNNNEIDVTDATAAAEFTIDVTAGTLQSASGLYIGKTANSNGMDSNAETAYTNTFSIDEDGNATIVSSGGAYLRYNSASNQTRFRYYKSASYTEQKAIQLYKKVENTPQTVEVTIAAAATDGSVNYGTLYYDNMNLSVPEGVKAYTASVSNGKITLSEVQGAIPAGTGVVLKTDSKLTSNTPFTFTEATEPGTAAADNMLLGTDDVATTTAPEGSTGTYKFYALSLNGNLDANSVGFYYREEGGAAFQNGAHKAYLAVPADQAGQAKGFAFNDIVTAINGVAIETGNAAIYNLNGQRVDKNYKGVVILNGKKMINK